MQHKKIIHIITQLELGGAQKTTLALLEQISNPNCEIHLITSPGGLLEDNARSIQGLQILLLPTLSREINIFKDAVSFWQILRYLKCENPSIVHTHSSKAGVLGRWAAKCAGVKKIFHTVHGWPFYIETNIIVRSLYICLEKVTSWITTKLIVVSNADLKEGLKYVNKDRSKYAKIPYGIKSSVFLQIDHKNRNNNVALRKSLGIEKDACVVGNIACFKPQKAPFDFIKVAKGVMEKNVNVQFLSVGDGLLRPAAEKLALKVGLNGRVKFLGWQKDMISILSIVDIVLSTSRWEGLPVVFLEAMASGVPIIATDVGGASEVVKDGINGFLSAKGDKEKLAEDIILLTRDPDKRRLFSERARKNFKKDFDISHMTAHMQKIYEHTVKVKE